MMHAEGTRVLSYLLDSPSEIRRRIKKASETFRRLWRVWAMKGLSLKLKGRLYSAFVHSVLLYDCEV